MNMRLRNKPGLFRRYFFRFFPTTAWYFLRDEPEIKVNRYKTQIDDPIPFEGDRMLTFMIIGAATTVLSAVCFIFGIIWLLSETVKSLILIP